MDALIELDAIEPGHNRLVTLTADKDQWTAEGLRLSRTAQSVMFEVGDWWNNPPEGVDRVAVVQSEEWLSSGGLTYGLEDYSADFLTMLETWEAALSFTGVRQAAQNTQPLEIAKILGWVRPMDGRLHLQTVAEACNSAAQLNNPPEGVDRVAVVQSEEWLS